MYTCITIFTIIVCLLLSAVVVLQNPKGGGLNRAFGGAQFQLIGVRRSTVIIERLTWGLGIGIIMLCLSASFFV